jgi:hypothetical protein
VLIAIEMHAINPAASCNASRVKEMTTETGGNLHIGVRQTGASLLGATKFRRNTSPWRADLRWANYQNWWNGHSWLDGRLSDFVDQRSDALSRRPSVIVGMAELKVVRSQHKDDERQWRIDLNALCEALKPVPTWFEWVVPDGTSTI